MSDREFREIELGTKQVIFIVMSTVVIAVVIFLLGVAVGRGVRGTVEGTEADSATTEPLTPVAGGVADPSGKTEPELDYHDLLMGQGSGATAEPPPVEPPTPPVEPPVEPPTTVSEPVREGTAPTPTGEAWYLQVGAYSTTRVAEGQVAAVKKLNMTAFVLPPGNGVKLFRVRVGPFSTRAQADEARTRLVREGFKPTVTK
jgi:hypothetical protein